jgi:drug/metabolite transporter (DMT)-like permease
MAEVDLSALQNLLPYDPAQMIGIPVALAGAVFMSVGAQMQHAGVGRVGRDGDGIEKSGLNIKQLVKLLGRPLWLVGTIMLGLAVLLQLTSLAFSPLILVQPIGAVALVITTFLNARVSKVRLNRPSIWAVVMCVGGIGLFVTIASMSARNTRVTQDDLVQILVLLGFVMLALSVLFAVFRKHASALYYIIGTGVLYGFVATLAKVVLTRIIQNDMDVLTWVCLVALLGAATVGGFFVQNAYSSGPPDLVIAGLTVIDPLVAVAIGILVLDEAAQAQWYDMAAYGLAGLIAVVGVFLLARFHPQTHNDIDAAFRGPASSRRP